MMHLQGVGHTSPTSPPSPTCPPPSQTSTLNLLCNAVCCCMLRLCAGHEITDLHALDAGKQCCNVVHSDHITSNHSMPDFNNTSGYTTLHCTALHCTALHCTALHCATLRYTTTQTAGECESHDVIHGGMPRCDAFPDQEQIGWSVSHSQTVESPIAVVNWRDSECYGSPLLTQGLSNPLLQHCNSKQLPNPIAPPLPPPLSPISLFHNHISAANNNN